MFSSSVTSLSMSLNALPSAARKHTDPAPVGLKSVPASSVSNAPGSAKSWSRFGGTGLVRPSSVSRNPTRAPLLAELLGDLVQLSQPVLQRRVSGEQRGHVLAVAGGQGRSEEERVQR